MKAHIPLRKYLVASALAWGAAGGMGAGLLLQSPPAHAIPVFDSANYAQNLLTAARTLQQINQQIQSLQNEASMLTNMAKNLSRISFPELTELSRLVLAANLSKKARPPQSTTKYSVETVRREEQPQQ